MDIDFFVKLTSKAWALKILALMQGGVPGRQAALVAETAASRNSIGASLHHLVDLGLLERNPGYGHPLRPEFRLTSTGAAFARLASRVVVIASEERAFAIVKRSWSMPILAVTELPQRFAVIKSGLGPVTDRALSQSLLVLEEHEWIHRKIDTSARTPFPTYQAVNAGRKINLAINMFPI